MQLLLELWIKFITLLLKGNGWRILFHKTNGDTIALTAHSGTEKLYHTLDKISRYQNN